MENNTELEYPAEWLPYCYGIENMLKIKKFQICLIFQIILIAAILIGILILVRQYIRCKIVLHGNLLLLFANMIFLYFLNVSAIIAMNLRYMILFSSYEHPCQLLTPVWLIPFFVAPNYLYTAAFPAFHFFIMIERYRATVLVEKYEREGRKFDIKTALLIWTISIGYMIYVILSAFADIQAFNHPQSMPTLTSQYNAKVNLYVNISMPPLIVLTAFCDWRISVMNRRKKNNSKQYHFGHYNLSQNYQLKENELTMRLILPLDISYACIYSLYQALIIIIRAYQPVIPKNDFTFYYIMANNLIYIYIAVAIIVYIQFVRHLNKRKRRLVLKENKIAPADQQINKTETDIYFKQLKEQWA